MLSLGGIPQSYLREEIWRGFNPGGVSFVFHDEDILVWWIRSQGIHLHNGPVPFLNLAVIILSSTGRYDSKALWAFKLMMSATPDLW